MNLFQNAFSASYLVGTQHSFLRSFILKGACAIYSSKVHSWKLKFCVLLNLYSPVSGSFSFTIKLIEGWTSNQLLTPTRMVQESLYETFSCFSVARLFALIELLNIVDVFYSILLHYILSKKIRKFLMLLNFILTSSLLSLNSRHFSSW